MKRKVLGYFHKLKSEDVQAVLSEFTGGSYKKAKGVEPGLFASANDASKDGVNNPEYGASKPKVYRVVVEEV